MRSSPRLARIASALALVALLGSSLPIRPAAAQTPSSALQITGRDAGGIDLALRVATVDVQPTADGSYAAVTIPGLVAAGAPGDPELPMLSARLVLPPGVPVALTVEPISTYVVPLEAPPLPAAKLSAELGQDGVTFLETSTREPGPVYVSSGVFPPELCAITADELVRQWRLIQVACTPARYQPADRSLLVTREARLRLSFADNAAPPPELAPQSIDPLAGAIAQGLLNPGDMSRYRGGGAGLAAAAALPEPAGTYRLMVDGSGLYAVTYAELKSAGADLAGVDPKSIRLYLDGQEVAIQVQGDRILFYGQERNSVYGTTNSYLLAWGGGAGSRVSSRASGTPSPNYDYLLAEAMLRNYDPRYPDPWRSDWTDLYLYDRTYCAQAEDGHYYAGQLVPPGSQDEAADPEWFAASLAGVAGSEGTLTVTLRSPVTPSSNTVDFQFGYVAQASYATYVPFVSRGGAASATAVSAQGSEPPYRALGQRTWADSDPATFSFTVPVTEGLHVLKLTMPGQPTARVQVVAPRLLYPVARVQGNNLVAQGQAGLSTYRVGGFANGSAIVWDVTDPYHPTALTGIAALSGGRLTFADDRTSPGRYAIATESGLKRVSSIAALSPVALQPAAQYLIVTHPDLLAAANSLAAHRAATSGLSTRVVTTQSIYDRFSSGLMDAEAIRSFVHQAYATWRQPDGGPILAYLLLIGDGSYDFKDRLNHGLANYLPPYLGEDFDPHWEGQSASDHVFANERGVPPSVLVGRLPVRTADEAAAVVQKIVRYDTQGAGSASRYALFAADDPDSRDYGSGEQTSYSFTDMAEEAVADALRTGKVDTAGVRRVYHTNEQQLAQKPEYYWVGSDDDLAAATAALTDYWRQGAMLTYYSGHSQFWGWAFPSLLALADAQGLEQTPLTMLLSMTCFTGVFYHPNAPSLDEALLLVPDGGTIASLSPMGMGSSAGHRQMQGSAVTTLLEGGSIGEAMLAGKLDLTPVYRDLIDTHAVLGDPAQRLMAGTPPATTEHVLLPMVANAGD